MTSECDEFISLDHIATGSVSNSGIHIVRSPLLEEIKGYQVGSLDRYLFCTLRAVSAVPACGGNEAIRPTGETIRKGLQGCLNEIDKVVDTDSAEWNAIQESLTAYAQAEDDAERVRHFANAANKILMLLKGVKIEGFCAASIEASKVIQFVVDSSQKGVTCYRKADIIESQEELVPSSDASSLASGSSEAQGPLPSSEPPANVAAQNADSLLSSQTAPTVAVDWENGLMYLVFEEYETTPQSPAEWNPQIGSLGGNYFETTRSGEKESQQGLKSANAHGAQASTVPKASSSARLSMSQQFAPQTSHQPKGKPITKICTVHSRPHRLKPGLKRRDPPTTCAECYPKKAKLSERDGQELERDKVLVGPVTRAVVQLAECAAESMHNAFGRNHVLGLRVKGKESVSLALRRCIQYPIAGSRVSIWHFDHHESPMQMTGFDFLEDQHYFLLFLLALQRFNEKDWGFLPGFEKLVSGDIIKIELHDAWVGDPKGEKRTFTGRKEDTLYPPYGLGGRATGVLFGSVGLSGGEKDVVVKLAWPEKSRDREKRFVDEARKRFGTLNLPDYDPGDYLPDILAEREYPELDTGLLRAAVLEDESECGNLDSVSRIPYFIVMPKYQPITDLTHNWDEFMAAFFALFYCHAMLWSVGIRHRDISKSNLMWDPEEKKPKLCDFDLSQFCEPPQIGVPEEGSNGSLGLSNDGTRVFMADELLTEEAMEGSVKRVYRHEVEAFITVLVYIVCRYKDGSVRLGRPLEHWNQVDYGSVYMKRARSFREIADNTYASPDGVSCEFWKLIRAAVRRMIGFRHELYLLRERLDEPTVQPRRRSRPNEAPEDFNDLRALRKKILSWDLFDHPSAEPFVELMKVHIRIHDCDE